MPLYFLFATFSEIGASPDSASARVVLAGLVLAGLLGARGDRRAHVLGRVAEGVDEVLRVRAQAQRRAGRCSDDTAAARCAERRPLIRYQARCFSIRPRPNRSRSHVSTLLGARVLDRVDGIRERLPLQQLAVRARRLDELGLVRVEQRGRLGGRETGCRAQARRDVGDHLLHAAGEQLVLLVGAQAALDRARRRAEVGDRLAELAQAGAVEHLAGGLADGVARRGPRRPCP